MTYTEMTHTDSCRSESVDNLCWCGCGEKYKRSNSRFVPGHDNRAVGRKVIKELGFCCRADLIAKLGYNPLDKPLS